MRAVDAWLASQKAVPYSTCPRVIDVGFGLTPQTTQEWQHSLPAGVEVIGVEVDAAAVKAASQNAPGPTYVHLEAGGALPGPAAVIRALNVLRGATAAQAAEWHALWLRAVSPGGLLLEGSTDTTGQVACWAAHSAHRTQLVFFTDGSRGTGPWLFRDWLPRRWRRDVRPGTWIHRLLSTWASVASGPLVDHGARLANIWPGVTVAEACVMVEVQVEESD